MIGWIGWLAMGLSGPVASDPPACRAIEPIVRPEPTSRFRWPLVDPGPEMTRDLSAGGVVVLEVQVSGAGRPEKVTVVCHEGGDHLSSLAARGAWSYTFPKAAQTGQLELWFRSDPEGLSVSVGP